MSDLPHLDKGLSYKGQLLAGVGVPMVNLGCSLGRRRFESDALKHYGGDFQPRHTIEPGDLVLANTDITQKREFLGSPDIIPPVPTRTELIFTHHVYAGRLRSSKTRSSSPSSLFCMMSSVREPKGLPPAPLFSRSRVTSFSTTGLPNHLELYSKHSTHLHCAC